MEKDKQLTEQLIRATNEVRRKCNSLKRNRYDDEVLLEESYKPITKPLNEIVAKIEKIPETSTSTPAAASSSSSSSLKRMKKEVVVPSSDEDSDAYDSAEDEVHTNEHQNSIDHQLIHYLTMVDNNSSTIDKTYGVYIQLDKNQNNKKIYWLGNASNIINSAMKLNINSKEYTLTNGLCELIFLKEPRTYSQNDLETYAEILQRCNVYYRNYDNTGQIKGTNCKKYRMIIKPIVDEQKKQKFSGTGFSLMQLPKQNIDFIYWDDPNELIERLRLLISSTQAGNNGHNNEIMSIVQELREASIIQ